MYIMDDIKKKGFKDEARALQRDRTVRVYIEAALQYSILTVLLQAKNCFLSAP